MVYEVFLQGLSGMAADMRLNRYTLRKAVEVGDEFTSPPYKDALRIQDGQGHEWTYWSAKALITEIDATAPVPTDKDGKELSFSRNAVQDIIATAVRIVCRQPKMANIIWRELGQAWAGTTIDCLAKEYSGSDLADLPELYLAELISEDDAMIELLGGGGEDDLGIYMNDPDDAPDQDRL